MTYTTKNGKLVRVRKGACSPDPCKVTPYITLPTVGMADAWRAGMKDLTQAAVDYQSPERLLRLPKYSACLHEAGHCVVVASEGFAVKDAKVWFYYDDDGIEGWLGEFNRDDDGYQYNVMHIEQAVPPCCIQIAGRVSEQLFAPADFNLVAGLDELVYANILVLACTSKNYASGDKLAPARLWSYLIHRVETTLLSNESAVRAIADSLMLHNCVDTTEMRRLTNGISRHSPDIDIPLEPAPISDPIERLAGFQDDKSLDHHA
jgi:hypothetical protein